jgi:hypothetical protein
MPSASPSLLIIDMDLAFVSKGLLTTTGIVLFDMLLLLTNLFDMILLLLLSIEFIIDGLLAHVASLKALILELRNRVGSTLFIVDVGGRTCDCAVAS